MNEHYTPEQILLANELADILSDRDSLQLYAQFTKKYTAEHLRLVLSKVMAIDGSKIKKTRGALFTYLMKDHGKHLHSRS